MQGIFKLRKIFGFIFIVAVLVNSPSIAAATRHALSDQHIRDVVEKLMHEKNQKIEQLEARIKQLETHQAVPQTATQAQSTNNQTQTNSDKPKEESAENLALPPGTVAKNSHSESTIMSKLGDLGEEIEELKEGAKEKGLDISGFFDVNAKTDNSTDQTFSVGSVELDLEYDYNENFAASSAIVLCGNSSGVDSAAPAAIFCGGSGRGWLRRRSSRDCGRVSRLPYV